MKVRAHVTLTDLSHPSDSAPELTVLVEAEVDRDELNEAFRHRFLSKPRALAACYGELARGLTLEPGDGGPGVIGAAQDLVDKEANAWRVHGCLVKTFEEQQRAMAS